MYKDDDGIENDNKTIPKKPFLGIMFNCCGVYGRIYKNKAETAYVGRCPRCMRNIKVPVGKGGTEQRFFNAD